MAFSIDQFKTALALGGARPSLFEIQISLNTSDATIRNGLIKAPFLVKAATIPASTVNAFPVPYFGRQVKFSGDRVFDDWQVTVINDEDFAVRNAMEQWSQLINSHEPNLSSLRPGLGTTTGAGGYKANAVVRQYSKLGGLPVATYQFIGLFPTTITEIQLAWEATDQIEEFGVVFAYDYWERVNNEVSQ